MALSGPWYEEAEAEKEREDREKSPGNEDRHYRGKVQPKDLINAQAIEGTIGPHEAIMIEYLCRWRIKGGVEDLKKVSWWLTELLNVAPEILERVREDNR